jgi:hypothetical protein
VRAPDLGFGSIAKTATTMAIVLVTVTSTAVAQVGLSSRSQAIALVARVPVRASLGGISLLQQKTSGQVRETSATVRLATNTGYRLVVKAATPSGSRTWVRGADGKFHELVAGAGIIVVQEPAGNGEREREIQYRVESRRIERTEDSPPVRYEIVVDPTL